MAAEEEGPDDQIRSEIERRIVLQSRRVKVGPEHECFDEDTVADFLAAWWDLVEYYKTHNDVMMHVEVLLEYREWRNLFGGMQYNQRRSMDCRERADEAYAELNACMSDIILYVVRWLYPQGR